MKPSFLTSGRKLLVTKLDHAQTSSIMTQWVWLWGAALLGGFVVLYFFNPIEHAFYPACPFYKLTHLHCPGCGSLRALHQLTHGHISVAFHSNPLLIVSIPAFAWFAFRKLRRSTNHSASQTPIRPAVAWTIFAVVTLFGVLRNLPHPAFTWMSP